MERRLASTHHPGSGFDCSGWSAGLCRPQSRGGFSKHFTKCFYRSVISTMFYQVLPQPLPMVQENRHCPEQQICVLMAAFSMHEETEVWTPELFVNCCTFYPDGDLHLSSLLSSTLALMTGVSNVAEVCPSTVPRSLVIVVTANEASDWSVLSPHPSCALIGPASRCRRPFPDRPQKTAVCRSTSEGL